MANDLQGLGSNTPLFFELFSEHMDWQRDPQTKFYSHRKLVSFEKSATQILSFESKQPNELTFLVKFLTKKAHYEFCTFYFDRYGRHGRFWFPLPYNVFTLPVDALSGSTDIAVDSANFSYKGHERIYFLLPNGDIITRHVTASNLVSDTLTWSIAALDRTINKNTLVLSSLLLLCRFDVDRLSMQGDGIIIKQANVTIKELVQEYDSDEL